MLSNIGPLQVSIPRLKVIGPLLKTSIAQEALATVSSSCSEAHQVYFHFFGIRNTPSESSNANLKIKIDVDVIFCVFKCHAEQVCLKFQLHEKNQTEGVNTLGAWKCQNSP